MSDARIPLWSPGRRTVVGYALVDEVSVPRLEKYQWRRSDDGYATTSVCGGGSLLMHRYILRLPKAQTNGRGLCVDHINRDRLDNRLINLRCVTWSENAENREPFKPIWHNPLNEDLTPSRLPGVRWLNTGLWEATFKTAWGKSIRHLGVYATKREAEEAVLAARRRVVERSL